MLRPARPDDLEWFYALRREGFTPYVEQIWGPWDEAKQRPAAERDIDTLPFEIVERDGVRIAYQLVLRHADHWYLDEIGVVAAERLGFRITRVEHPRVKMEWP